MNKQSNVYTIIYIIVLVVVVGAALALTSMSLHDRQQANADADKMRQILASVHLSAPTSEIGTEFDRYITSQYIVDESGAIVSDNGAFSVDVAAQSKVEPAKRKLPVYECTLAAGDVKYIVPLYGAGLWGPIWGYVAFNADGSTLYGAYFAHQGETPGLGAEIENRSSATSLKARLCFMAISFCLSRLSRPVRNLLTAKITSMAYREVPLRAKVWAQCLTVLLHPMPHFFQTLEANNRYGREDK